MRIEVKSHLSFLYLPHFQNIQNLIENCPTINPTLEEFSDFTAFMEQLERQYMHQYGMVKIIPPAQWKPTAQNYESFLENYKISSPTKQNVNGSEGIYQFEHEGLGSKSLASLEKQNAKPPNFQTSDEYENQFWRGIVNNSPIYGSDVLQTLMDQSAGSWHLDHLNTLLDKGLPKKIKGINNSFCYFGAWRTLFCWHKQDLDLSAINYLHNGKPKFWYCIQPQNGVILEKEAKKHFLPNFLKCPEYLRHKSTLINPYKLKKLYPSLKITKMMQKEGQFIVAFGGAYHCGFNFGRNVAEAVNFATMNWLTKLGLKMCQCRKSSVRINPHAVLYKLGQYKQIRSDPRYLAAKQQIERQFTKQGLQIEQEMIKQQLERIEEIQRMKAQQCSKNEGSKTKNIKKGKKCVKTHKISKKETNKGRKEKNQEKQNINYFQCDRCNQWNILPQNYQKTILEINQMEFCCENIGKQCKKTDLVEEQKSIKEEGNNLIQAQ